LFFWFYFVVLSARFIVVGGEFQMERELFVIIVIVVVCFLCHFIFFKIRTSLTC